MWELHQPTAQPQLALIFLWWLLRYGPPPPLAWAFLLVIWFEWELLPFMKVTMNEVEQHVCVFFVFRRFKSEKGNRAWPTSRLFAEYKCHSSWVCLMSHQSMFLSLVLSVCVADGSQLPLGRRNPSPFFLNVGHYWFILTSRPYILFYFSTPRHPIRSFHLLHVDWDLVCQ